MVRKDIRQNLLKLWFANQTSQSKLHLKPTNSIWLSSKSSVAIYQLTWCDIFNNNAVRTSNLTLYNFRYVQFRARFKKRAASHNLSLCDLWHDIEELMTNLPPLSLGTSSLKMGAAHSSKALAISYKITGCFILEYYSIDFPLQWKPQITLQNFYKARMHTHTHTFMFDCVPYFCKRSFYKIVLRENIKNMYTSKSFIVISCKVQKTLGYMCAIYHNC
jgi:hypothetical protein